MYYSDVVRTDVVQCIDLTKFPTQTTYPYIHVHNHQAAESCSVVVPLGKSVELLHSGSVSDVR